MIEGTILYDLQDYSLALILQKSFAQAVYLGLVPPKI